MASMDEGEFLGLPALLIRTPLATAALSLHGGQLLSFVPQISTWLPSVLLPY